MRGKPHKKSVELTSNEDMKGQLLLKESYDTIKKQSACLLAVEFITGEPTEGLTELSQT